MFNPKRTTDYDSDSVVSVEPIKKAEKTTPGQPTPISLDEQIALQQEEVNRLTKSVAAMSMQLEKAQLCLDELKGRKAENERLSYLVKKVAEATEKEPGAIMASVKSYAGITGRTKEEVLKSMLPKKP